MLLIPVPQNSCHGGHRVGRGRCWTSHAVRFADNTILSYLINVVPSIQCCVPVISSGLRSAVRRRLTSGRTVVSVVRINSDISGELYVIIAFIFTVVMHFVRVIADGAIRKVCGTKFSVISLQSQQPALICQRRNSVFDLCSALRY